MFTLRPVTTVGELEAALSVRKRVFVDEQGVSPELELDEHDVLGGAATHAVALIADRVVAAGRLRKLDHTLGKLERLAVLPDVRGKGIGLALTRYLEQLANEQGLQHLTLNAQQSASGFYQKLGYLPLGPTFIEAGIVHQRMEKVVA